MAEEKEEPLTHKDVLKLIQENGGTAQGLDLSGQTFVEAINLSDLDLHGIILKDARFPTHFEDGQLVGAKFDGSNLNGADLRDANLQYAKFNPYNTKPTCLQGADLRGATLSYAEFKDADLSAAKFGVQGERSHKKAQLDKTDLRGAKLFLANFKGCYFYGTKLEGAFIRGADIFDAHLEEADWGNCVIGEEKRGNFSSTMNIYRCLKQWYTNAGMYDTAGEFFYREMEAKRKALEWQLWPPPLSSIRHTLYGLLCGYGERPWQVFASAAVVVLGLALIYFAIGTLTPGTFLNSLYYSAVSFTALGYGSWAPEPTGWVIKAIGALEAFVGVFMMALFLITFTRKMTR